MNDDFFHFPNLTRQENFVLDLLKEKRGGCYVELGAFHSRNGSNTFTLENDYDWYGVSFEVDAERRQEFSQNRRNPCMGDAVTFNFRQYFEINHFPNQIDFLQIDIDDGGPHQTRHAGLHALLAIPLSVYRFTIITFEHDSNIYFRNTAIRDAQREILDSLGYMLVVRDIHEDYWVDSRMFRPDECLKYRSPFYQYGMQVNYQ